MTFLLPVSRQTFSKSSAGAYIRAWLLLSVTAGVASGLGASAFFLVVHVAARLTMMHFGGLSLASVMSDRSGLHDATGPLHPWLVPIVVACGSFASGLLVWRFTGHTNGGGTNATIATAHDDPASMGLWTTVVKFAGAAITIGSGGSSGSEGPAAQLGAGFSSVIARRFRLDMASAHVLVVSGMAASVGAIFRAPLGGALLGAELLYRRDMATDAIMPSCVSSVVAYSIFGTFNGFRPMFGDHRGYQFDRPVELATFAMLGLLAGILGRLYVRCLSAASQWFSRWPLHPTLRPAIAGLVVGLMGLIVPGVLGTGYGSVQQALDARHLLAIPLLTLVTIPFAKIVSTSLTMGSGAPGGVFGPGMVIGATAGGALWRLLEPLGLCGHSPVPFVIVGMAACLGSIAHAPLAVLLMAVETTNDFSLLIAPMIGLAIATLVVGEVTLFRSQLTTRTESRAGRLSFPGNPNGN